MNVFNFHMFSVHYITGKNESCVDPEHKLMIKHSQYKKGVK